MTALGLHPKASLNRGGVEWGSLANMIPERLRRRYGLVLDREVDVVIDAAGFAYSDQWGRAPLEELARSTRRWRRRGTKVILLPQAFGPFTDVETQKLILGAVNNADLVLPRDSISYRYLTDVTGQRDYIQQYPDFTNLIEGVAPEGFNPGNLGVALVPNVRMTDMTGDTSADRYVEFMTTCAKHLLSLKASPYLLVHEGAGDERLAQEIAAASGGIPVVKEEDPLKLKGLLGASRAVVASRYHALISALSQGVPAVATGWSHKYTELFKDYEFPEGVLSLDDDAGHVNAMLDRLVDTEASRNLSVRLLESSERLKDLSETMWSAVESVIDGRRQ
jgi:colanic acid/amylovoran biosynthesis protein